MIKDIVIKNRSYRRYDESNKVTLETLKELVNLARLSGSAGNLQQIKYRLVVSDKERAEVFPNIHWAGYLRDWDGPEAEERPAAYILMLSENTGKRPAVNQIDIGIACQSILMGAVEKGLGGCMLGAIDRDNIKSALNIPNEYNIELAISLGKPKQNVIIDEIDKNGDIKYWVDKDGNHHVPKRKLEDVII